MTEEFLKLYSDSQRRMYAYLRTQVFNSQDADDVFQDVAVVLWRNFPQYDRSKDFTRWACGIVPTRSWPTIATAAAFSPFSARKWRMPSAKRCSA